MKRVFHPAGRVMMRTTPVQFGVLFVAFTLTASLMLFNKSRITTELHGGRTLTAEFVRTYNLRPYVTQVKLSGLAVGKVTSVKPQGSGARVVMKVNGDVPSKLGPAPTASIRPTTLLGGNMFVDLRPGGGTGTFTGVIPAARTTVPVELDRVLDAVDGQARQGLRTAVAQLNTALATGGSAQVAQLAADAPATLDPAAAVLGALRGSAPDDLQALVQGVENTTAALTRDQGRVDSLITGTASLGSALGDNGPQLADTARRLQTALPDVQQALAALDGSLVRLQDTAGPLRPVVTRLERVLAQAGPVIAQARPVVADLRPSLSDLNPTIRDAVPAVSSLNSVLGDVQGQVINRILNPIIPTVLRPYGGSKTNFYQEAGYMIAGLDGLCRYRDANGYMCNFNATFNEESIGGLPQQSPFSSHNHPAVNEKR